MIFRRLSQGLTRLPSYRRASGGPVTGGLLVDIGAAVAIAALATGIRAAADPYLPPGFPYVTYFPAVILTGFVFGFRAGIIAALLCGICAWYFFIPPLLSFGLGTPAIVALLFYAFVVAVDLGLIHMMMWAFAREAKTHRELEGLLAQQRLLEREVDHRVKNLFQTLSGLVTLSQRNAGSADELAEALKSRIAAMGRSHSILRGALAGDRASIHQVFRTALEPFDAGDGRIRLEGGDVTPNGTAMLSLSLIVNELATNAVKHGALRGHEGRVHLSWEIDREAGTSTIVWQEETADIAAPSARQGFGSQLIPTLARALGGTAAFDFRETGLTCRLTLATAQIAAEH